MVALMVIIVTLQQPLLYPYDTLILQVEHPCIGLRVLGLGSRFLSSPLIVRVPFFLLFGFYEGTPQKR